MQEVGCGAQSFASLIRAWLMLFLPGQCGSCLSGGLGSYWEDCRTVSSSCIFCGVAVGSLGSQRNGVQTVSTSVNFSCRYSLSYIPYAR